MLKNFLNNYIYIYHLISNEGTGEGTFLLLPQFPEQIQDSMSSNFQETNALARSAPVFSYTNSGPRQVQITLNLHRDMMDDINLNISNMEKFDIADDYVDTLIKSLQSISVPRYEASNKAVQPPMIAIRFGDEIFIKGIVNGDISVTYTKPLINVGTISNPRFKYAQVEVSFNVTEIDPYDASTIALQGSFRGITSTFNNLHSNYINRNSSSLYKGGGINSSRRSITKSGV